VAGRFPLYTDADIHGPLILALRRRGWDLVRAIDLYPPGTADVVHFECAARDSRVLVSNDADMEVIANRWLADGRPFRGLILWPQEPYKRMGYGELLSSIEALSEPFPHPVIHLRPPRSSRTARPEPPPNQHGPRQERKGGSATENRAIATVPGDL
jgi:hypothetical protein